MGKLYALHVRLQLIDDHYGYSLQVRCIERIQRQWFCQRHGFQPGHIHLLERSFLPGYRVV